ncbi:MAG: ABC transporter permease [Chloroflexi bacterium]|nr:ABC transporter permease [Chloroflexota bacterium]
MGRYLTRRLLQSLLMLVLLTFGFYYMIFALGDPLARLNNIPGISESDKQRIRADYGLERPVWAQYIAWAGGVLRGDLGKSFVNRQPVIIELSEALRNTLILMVTAFVVTLLVAIPIGIYSALRQYSFFDHLITGLSFVFFSTPVFMMGFVLIFLLAIKFKEWGLPYFPPGKMYDLREGPSLESVIYHLVLPVLTLVLIQAALYVRYLRSSMLEVLSQDYLRTARAKGLPNRTVLQRHAFKNAALPLVTLIMLQLAALVSGAVVTERLFSWPGMGTLFINSVDKVDYPVLMAILTIAATMIIICNLLADVVYAYLDPRIKYS